MDRLYKSTIINNAKQTVHIPRSSALRLGNSHSLNTMFPTALGKKRGQLPPINFQFTLQPLSTETLPLLATFAYTRLIWVSVFPAMTKCNWETKVPLSP